MAPGRSYITLESELGWINGLCEGRPVFPLKHLQGSTAAPFTYCMLQNTLHMSWKSFLVVCFYPWNTLRALLHPSHTVCSRIHSIRVANLSWFTQGVFMVYIRPLDFPQEHLQGSTAAPFTYCMLQNTLHMSWKSFLVVWFYPWNTLRALLHTLHTVCSRIRCKGANIANLQGAALRILIYQYAALLLCTLHQCRI